MIRKILKTWVTFIVLSSLISVASAADWKLVYEGAGYRSEIDQESIVRSGNLVKAWDRLIPPGGLAADEGGFTYRHIMTWSEYDCASRRVTAYRRIYVGESAREVKEQNPIRHPVVDVKAGTPRERLWAAACNVAIKSQPVASTKPAVTTTTQTKPAAVQPARPASASSQPQLLPNRKDTEISKKPETPVVTKPTPSTKPATTAQTKPTATKESTKAKEPEKQPENVYQYLQNQLREGRSGEVIIVTTQKPQTSRGTRQ